MKPIILSTERLILRRAIDIDPENLFRNYTGDIDCSRFLTRKPHKDVDQTAAFLNKWCDIAWEQESDQFSWVVSLPENNEAIGVFIVSKEGHKSEIHSGIGRIFWGKGFATEIGHKVVEWLMAQPEL